MAVKGNDAALLGLRALTTIGLRQAGRRSPRGESMSKTVTRQELTALGVELLDSATGTDWKLVK